MTYTTVVNKLYHGYIIFENPFTKKIYTNSKKLCQNCQSLTALLSFLNKYL